MSDTVEGWPARSVVALMLACALAGPATAEGSFAGGSFDSGSFDSGGGTDQNGQAQDPPPTPLPAPLPDEGGSFDGSFEDGSFEDGSNDDGDTGTTDPVIDPAPTPPPIPVPPVPTPPAPPNPTPPIPPTPLPPTPTPQPMPVPTPVPTPAPQPQPGPQETRIDPQILAFESRDFGVQPVGQLRQGAMHSQTPTGIPGGQVVSTQNLVNAIANGTQILLIDVLGGQYALPGALTATPMAQGGSFNDNIQQQTVQWLGQISGGRRDVPIVIYCSDPMCWLSYNAALRAISAGYTNVYWYRGGVTAWQMAGLPMMPASY